LGQDGKCRDNVVNEIIINLNDYEESDDDSEIFSFSLSIDEQMVPHFGRHSCKMYIKGKPVKFGFKLWCLCSSEGYPYQLIPYANANKEKSYVGMGGQVVLELLSLLKNINFNFLIFVHRFYQW
jgi:hypothetical protein